MIFPDIEALLAQEDDAYNAVLRLAHEIAVVAKPIAHQGDGNCGIVLMAVIDELRAAGLYKDRTPSNSSVYTKEKIKPSLRTAVFERDAYRCKNADRTKTCKWITFTPKAKEARLI